MNEKNNDTILRSNLKKMIKKTSKNDVLLTFDKIYSTSSTTSVPIELISDSKYLINAPVSEKSLVLTRNALKMQHNANPILIREIRENLYEVVVGRRRFYAYKELNYSFVNAIVTTLSDEDAIFCTLFNSLDKHHKNILELATLFNTLNKEYRYSLTELSNVTGISVSQISNLIRVLDLDIQIKNFISNDDISLGQAKCLCSLEKNLQIEAANTIVKNKLSVKETEKLCKNLTNDVQSFKNERIIREKFSAKNVNIKSKSIELKFKSKHKLEEFLKYLKTAK